MKKRIISSTRTNIAVLLFIVSIVITCIVTTYKVVAITTKSLNMYDERAYIAEEIQDVQEYIMMDIQVRKDELIKLDDTYQQMMEIGGHNSDYLKKYDDIDLWLDDYEGVIRIIVTEKSENIEWYYVPKKTTTILSKEMDTTSTTELYSSQGEYMSIVKNNIEKNILKVGIIFIGMWTITVVFMVIIKRIKKK